MPSSTQSDRLLELSTPLGKDKLLLVGIKGSDAISSLFKYKLELLAENGVEIPFDLLIGQKACVRMVLPDKKARHFSGIIQWFTQGKRGEHYTAYFARVVPQFWLLTRRTQSRIFQHQSVPDILRKVLEGLNCDFDLRGHYEPRDYCVQYRESDFDFASRLMEEEGIFYFFVHSESGETLVVADGALAHPDVPEFPTVIFERDLGGNQPDDRVLTWEKTQELRSGKVTLWDHCFEVPHQNLEADKSIQESVEAGEVVHKLKLSANAALELYDFPGGYASRFDGITPGGTEQPADVQKIFADNRRVAAIRMQEEARLSLEIEGTSECRQFVSGHKFTLERHFNADGTYLLTSTRIFARFDSYRSDDQSLTHEVDFTCIPIGLPFRPERVTPRPVVEGTQTAVVVGPQGEEIFTDKYGRVRVQFHWDREGKKDANSSCWIRVASSLAGKNWGSIHLPRIGQEVVVGFLEGDPNEPIIVGMVYNAEQMPPYKLPDRKTQSGLLTRSSKGGNPETCNELGFEDKKGEELVYIRAEKDFRMSCEHDEFHWVGHDRSDQVDKNETITVGKDRSKTVEGNETVTIGKTLRIQVGDEISLTTGAASITMKKDGTIVLSGKDITIQAAGKASVKAAGEMVLKGLKIAIN